MKLEITDKNSIYIGDGVYIVFDEYKRLWLCTYYGIEITNQICLEERELETFVNVLLLNNLITAKKIDWNES